MTLLRDTKADIQHTIEAVHKAYIDEQRNPGEKPVKADALKETNPGSSTISNPETAQLDVNLIARQELSGTTAMRSNRS